MCAIMSFCLIEKDMRHKTTSNRDRQRRSDSNNTRKQRPSSRIHCLRDACERQGVDKYRGACEPFDIRNETMRAHKTSGSIKKDKNPDTTEACAAGVVTKTTDGDSLRYTYNGIQRMHQLALGCESN